MVSIGITMELRTVCDKNDPKQESKKIPTIEEIQRYQDARYILLSLAAWKELSCPMVEYRPSDERLDIHLGGQYKIYFEEEEQILQL